MGKATKTYSDYAMNISIRKVFFNKTILDQTAQAIVCKSYWNWI